MATSSKRGMGTFLREVERRIKIKKMKLNFKKISAVLGSVVMAGASLGFAAAAAYPAPFVSGGSANVAIVYGTGAGVNPLDMVQAGSIQNDLSGYVTGGSVSVEGGEAFMLDKAANNDGSDHFNFNDALNAVYTSLDEDEMENFLSTGTYDDGDIDETYEQDIVLGTKQLALFADPDYNDDAPTVGFWWTNNQYILNYSIEFDDGLNLTDMEGTDMPFLGREYYVLNAPEGGTTVDILDTANSQILLEGETVTVSLDEESYTVSVAIFEDGARFTVNGALSDKIDDGEYDEVMTDVYVVAKSVDYVSKETGISQVEFSLGKGKIELIHGEEAELNDEDIDGLEVYLAVSSGLLDKITLEWNSDDDTFLGDGDSVALPAFGAISLAYNGLEMPSNPETISVESGDTLVLNMGNYPLPVAWIDSTGNASLGEEDHLLKVVPTDYTYADLGFNNETAWWGTNISALAAGNLSTVGDDSLNLSEGERFIATRIDTDLGEVETLYYEVQNIDIDDHDTWIVELEDKVGDNDLTFQNDIDDTDNHGDVTVTLAAFDQNAANVSAIFEFSVSSGSITLNKAVSEKGLIATLPTSVSNVGQDGAGYAFLNFTEADKDQDLGEGMVFSTTFRSTTNDKLHVSAQNVTVVEESDDHDIGYVLSDLTSKITFDTSADENEYSIEYFGEEVIADVQVIGGGEVSSSSGLGDVLVMDSEVSNVASRNLIIVGGSCINSAAATALGVSEHTCEAAFTAATGVSAGQFLIKGVQDAFSSGRLALVVAGYETADTVNAATYLTNVGVADTSAEYKGTSATSADLVVA